MNHIASIINHHLCVFPWYDEVFRVLQGTYDKVQAQVHFLYMGMIANTNARKPTPSMCTYATQLINLNCTKICRRMCVSKSMTKREIYHTKAY
jgi:hypothetical protein